MKVRAIVYREQGIPSSVAQLEEIELLGLQPGEVLVRMQFAPINPADLNIIEGKYPLRQRLENGAVPGVEGVGLVEQIASDVEGVALGALVLLPPGIGTWCEACIVQASRLVAVPPGIKPEQASMLRVNPATALRLLRDFVDLQPGDWVIQNAANSAVGRAVIQIARSCGLRTVNIARRPELIPELKAEGADIVLLEDEASAEQIASVTNGAAISLALNCVGGESALRLAEALATDGTLVTYGAMARQPLRIPNGLLIFKNLAWRGFWLTKWFQEATPEAQALLFEELFAMARAGVIRTPIEKVYPLAEIKAALERAHQGRRGGKILLVP